MKRLNYDEHWLEISLAACSALILAITVLAYIVGLQHHAGFGPKKLLLAALGGGMALVAGTMIVARKHGWRILRVPTWSRTTLLVRQMIASGSLEAFAGIGFASLVEFRLIMAIHQSEPDALALAKTAYQVVVGTPQWRAFQNRLLGPYVTYFISWLTGLSYFTSYYLFVLVLLIMTNVAAVIAFRHLTNEKKLSLEYAFYFLVMFLAFQPRSWLFIWDFIDMPVFLLFAYGVFKRKSVAYFVPIALVEMFNREVALYIPLWLVIDSISSRELLSGHRIGFSGINLRKLAAGIFLAVPVILYTEATRYLLFVESSLPSGLSYLKNEIAGGNTINLLDSISMSIENVIAPTMNLDILVNMFWIGLAIWLARNRRRLLGDQFKVLLLFLAMLISIPVWGFFNETRQYFILIPFLLMLDLSFRGKISGLRVQIPESQQGGVGNS